MPSPKRFLVAVGCMMLLSTFTAGAASGQEGSVTGVVTQAGSGQPMEGALVQVAGTELTGLTRETGRFLITGVPAGSHTLRFEVIGHAVVEQPITVSANETETANVVLEPDAISLQEIVVTGTAGAATKAKVPFEVSTINVRDLPVPAINVGASIQGKVAGATVLSGSGRPGEDPSIVLRGATSINASGRDQEPLLIVDGVILGSGVSDIAALDIEHIEVVKGAAAASLYGSRAANGVIQIVTRRGKTEADNQVRYTLRSEWGRSTLQGEFPLLQHHAWKVNDAGTMFIDRDGSECHFLDCQSPQLAGQRVQGDAVADAWNTFATSPWPGGTVDHVARFFEGGDFFENYISAAGRTGATNFHVSVSHLNEGGVMTGAGGQERTNVRLNVDQSVRENLEVSASAFYSTRTEDPRQGALFDFTRMQSGIDLTVCLDENDKIIPGSNCLNNTERLLLNTNPTNTESENPLYPQLVQQEARDRGRFLASGNAIFRPLTWLELDGNISYDRLDREDTQLLPKGYRTINPSTTQNEGQLEKRDEVREAINASVTGTVRFDLGDNVSNVTKVRYLYEQQDREWNATDGFRFAVADVPRLDNLDPETLDATSFISAVRADGYFLITDFDIADKYVINLLARNDGSSLFGPEERRHWYYAARGAWRLGEELNIPGVDELKLRYAFGTAGNRPSFDAQYETYSIDAGSVIPINLGNKKLKPEFTTEHEVGLDAALLNGRLGITLTYANAKTREQILPVPLPRYTGFGTQWQNAGTLASNTWELSIDGVLVQSENVHWSARLLFDRTRSTITELNRPAFTYGVGGQGLGSVFYAREGEEYSTYYGVHYATSCADLPTATSCDGFAVNDDGWLVWVGGGGLSANEWGTKSDVTVRGSQLDWGTPFAGECTDRSTGERTQFCPVGRGLPDYNVRFSSTFSWKGLSVYGMLDAIQGFSVYNQPLQWALFRRNINMMDQTGLPEQQQKPIGYYDALYGVSGLQPSNVFVEDGSFVKLREVSLSYRFGPDLLGSLPFEGAALRLTGRNLHTWSNYRGYDPETGAGGGDTGSAALARVDGYRYPNFRTWTLGVELNF